MGEEEAEQCFQNSTAQSPRSWRRPCGYFWLRTGELSASYHRGTETPCLRFPLRQCLEAAGAGQNRIKRTRTPSLLSHNPRARAPARMKPRFLASCLWLP